MLIKKFPINFPFYKADPIWAPLWFKEEVTVKTEHSDHSYVLWSYLNWRKYCKGLDTCGVLPQSSLQASHSCGGKLRCDWPGRRLGCHQHLREWHRTPPSSLYRSFKSQDFLQFLPPPCHHLPPSISRISTVFVIFTLFYWVLLLLIAVNVTAFGQRKNLIPCNRVGIV